jgi:2-iminobutanoate/2-iminopropanoate deaminase
MKVERIQVEGMARLPAFSHATRAGGFVYVSGTLGTEPGSFELVAGGTGAQTRRTLENIARILEGCSVGWDDVVKVNVFLSDMTTFGEMNRAYLEVIGEDGPARITVGRAELALGAAVEIDCIAYCGEDS